MTKKVIIIDDSLASLNLIKMAFSKYDWEVYGSQHAKDAIEMVYDIAPDIIVTDAIMPVMGGFQFLKTLRSDPKTAKIPVIVYSVLEEKNSKFYIKEERAEYYLKKSDDTDKLINLASEVIINHPLSDNYKFEILSARMNFDNEEIPKEKPIEEETPPIDFEELDSEIKKHYDFTRSDDKILSDIFSILYSILDYNLAVICVETFEKKENTAFFDIRDVILSPIFQNDILNNLSAKNSFLFKKYVPNLKVVTNENEFLSKINFKFEHDSKFVGEIVFWAKEKTKWTDNRNIETIKNVMANFFRARYINKSSKIAKTNTISSRYFIDKIDFKFDFKSNKELYCAIVEIANYKDLQENLSSEDLDFVNSKISERLINFISDDEQIFKNDEDEYNLVFYAKDNEHAIQKLEWVINLLDEINIEENKIEIQIGASNCKLEGQFNFYEAQKLAREALDNSNNQNRIVMYDSK